MIRKTLLAIAAVATLAVGTFASVGDAEARHRNHGGARFGIFIGNGFGFNDGFDDDFGFGHRHFVRRGHCHRVWHRHHHGRRHMHRICHSHRGGYY
jgi:hypothetical protein